MTNVLKQIADNLGVVGYDDSSLLIGIADYYGVNTAISTSLMGDILDAVGGNASTSNNYIQDIVIALGGPSTSNNWIEEWEAITSGPIYFTTTWTTTAPTETITLPYAAAGTYSGTIDWGDSNTDVNSFANKTHTYAVAGTYTVTIIGDCKGWNFANYGGSTHITSVVNWGQLQLGANTGKYFKDCPNLNLSSVSDVLDLTGITNLLSMFQASGITTINNINLWNTSSVTNMTAMFHSALVFNQALSFDTGSVVNMNSMFENATAFNQNIGLWDVGNVTLAKFFMLGKTPATFSTANLDAIYNGWSASGVQAGVPINFGTAKYTVAAVAGRAILTGVNGWTITDGGL